MLETELLLPFELETGEPLILENEFFGDGGVVASGEAPWTLNYNPVIAGGISIAGTVDIHVIYNIDVESTSAGVELSGISSNGKVFNYFAEDGVFAAGRSIIKMGRSPKLIPRFSVGDLIYVPSKIGNYYLLQKITSTFINNKKPFYYAGIGWYSDDVVFSFEQYHHWLCTTDFGEIEEERNQLINNACG